MPPHLTQPPRAFLSASLPQGPLQKGPRGCLALGMHLGFWGWPRGFTPPAFPLQDNQTGGSSSGQVTLFDLESTDVEQKPSQMQEETWKKDSKNTKGCGRKPSEQRFC